MARGATATMTSTPPRSVGRPRDAEKREAILDTAWAMFLERGVQSTALDAVARQAGVSRVTLYSHFADKTALFETAVEREMTRLARTQAGRPPDQSLRVSLIGFGLALMQFLTSPGPASYYSVLAGELRRHPDLARRFYDLGPAVTLRNLAAILRTAVEAGQIRLSDPDRAAEQLFGLWQGVTNYQLALDLDRDALIDGLPARVTTGVDLFLAACAPARSV
jgi:TetR/AcrR family transcriptional regulator, mexJK operon transcriptional repressor